MFNWAGEVLDASYRSIILAHWLLKLHPSPKTTSKLGTAAKPQSPDLIKQTRG